MPKRIQLKRTKGWRKPAGAVNVARPTKWGNPFSIALFQGAISPRVLSVAAFKKWIYEPPRAAFRQQMREELGGKDLCCWCRLNQICHADIILEIANQ